MKRFVLYLLFILLWGLSIPMLLSAQDTKPLIENESVWQLDSDKDGIEIYTHKSPPENIVPLKAVMMVPDLIEEVIAVLDDKERRVEWAERFEASHLLDKTTLYDQVEYSRVGMPWPFSNRTTVLKVKITVSSDSKQVLIEGHSTTHPNADQYPKHVRAKIYDSSVKLEQLPNGTRITTLTYADPNGFIPSWVVNLFTERIARNTLVQLREQLAKDLYPPKYLSRFTYRIRNYAQLKDTPYTPEMNLRVWK